MQQIRPFPQIDKMKNAELSKTPYATTTSTLPPFDGPLTAQLPFPGESESSPATDQLAVPDKAKKPSAAQPHTSLLSALQAATNASKPLRRPLVIHAEKKRKKAAPSAEAQTRRLSPRLRQTIMFITIFIVLGITLVSLTPLATGQGGISLSSGINLLLQSAQNGWQILAHQDNSHSSTTSLPPMTIPHSQLVAIAEQDATNAGINPTYFVRQINLESGFNPYAVSPAGAEGIAQFEPSTAAGLGIDPFNPVQALQAAAQMMSRYYHQYGDYAKALAAYNAGPANLQNAENACGANWLSCMPAETQHYVKTIMGI